MQTLSVEEIEESRGLYSAAEFWFLLRGEGARTSSEVKARSGEILSRCFRDGVPSEAEHSINIEGL